MGVESGKIKHRGFGLPWGAELAVGAAPAGALGGEVFRFPGRGAVFTLDGK
jgi:hypothetical protein